MGRTDLGNDEGADDRRDEAKLGLREPERGIGAGDHDVADRAQSHAAAQRRALDAGDDRNRAGVDGLEHGLHGRCVALVLLDAHPDRRLHPCHVGPGAEDPALAGQDNAPHGPGWLIGEPAERRSQLLDELGVERVAHLRPRERDPNESGVAGDLEAVRHRPERRWNGSATARTWASSGSSSHTTSVPSGTSTVAVVPSSPTNPSMSRGLPSSASVSTR